ncbi:hypothetical protein GCM10009122_55910 [Fulvivirga kasyanovii]|uniref:AI-2E family transporter n=1 Tax=Fulvivirga kasyanovii TaxID=396812 RepID=A0ABW9RVT6_9BACT|nr:hypothetical protein [Fulvivirga kasyanovii]MTI27821.1 hypothetical protein [Fulvivirga kasyanovii]
MKFIIQAILIGVLCYATGQYLPFWSLAAVAFVIAALFRLSPLPSFMSGFLAVFALWSFLAYNIDQETSSLLTNRVAQVFMGIPNIALILITGFIGGLTGGFGAASGTLFIGLTRKKRVQKYYS